MNIVQLELELEAEALLLNPKQQLLNLKFEAEPRGKFKLNVVVSSKPTTYPTTYYLYFIKGRWKILWGTES